MSKTPPLYLHQSICFTLPPKAHATMSKVIMGNGSFYGCLIEPQGVSACWKETAQARVPLLSRSLFKSEIKLLLTIMPIDIVRVPFYIFCGTTFFEIDVYRRANGEA